MKRIIIFFLFILMLQSCDSIADGPWVELSPDDIQLQTDKSSYTAEPKEGTYGIEYTFDLITQFENRSGRTLYLATCNPNSVIPIYNLLMIDTEDGESGYSNFENCSGRQDPIIVQPDEIRIDTIEVRSQPILQDGENISIEKLEGQFRFVFDALSCPAGTRCQIADSLSWSNIFTIQLSQ